MKKILFAIFIFSLLVLSAPIAADALEGASPLPDIEGWTCGDIRRTDLNTVSGNRGQWIERDYRTSAGVGFHAVWIEGSAVKRWAPGKKETVSNDGAIGSGAVYKTTNAAGIDAVFESHPITGTSLSLKIGGGVLTLESKIAEEKELIDAASAIIDKVKK